ncbi:unnamed protein product [Leuciscus chuanchicus]
MEDHACSRGQVAESPRKRKRELKRQRDRQISKTKVNIGVTFPRWKELMRSNDFKTDVEVGRTEEGSRMFECGVFERLRAVTSNVGRVKPPFSGLRNVWDLAVGINWFVTGLEWIMLVRKKRKIGKWSMFQDESRQKVRELEEYIEKQEVDTDNEIYDIHMKYEQNLKEEKKANATLKVELDTTTKSFNGLQTEIDKRNFEIEKPLSVRSFLYLVQQHRLLLQLGLIRLHHVLQGSGLSLLHAVQLLLTFLLNVVKLQV